MVAQERENDTLTEVVLESNRFINPSPLITPATQISSGDIERYAPTEITTVLNETPGVHVFSGALNTNRLTVRGMGARTLYGTNKIQAYYNGIPITSGIGETAFNIYDPESLEQIEIIKGPKATTYGSNLGGALLLNTKLPEKNKTTFRNSFTVGSYGLLKNSLQAGYRDDSFYINLLSDHLQTDGYRENSNYDRDAIFLDAGFQLNDKNKIKFLVNQLNYNAQIPSSINETDFNEDPTRAAANWKAAQGFEDNKITTTGLTYEHLFSKNIKNTTTLFYSYTDHYEPRPFNILDEFTNSYGFRTVLAGSINALPFKNKFTTGAELYSDTYNWSTFENLYEQNNNQGSLQGARLSDNKEYRTRWNTFANFSAYFGKWVAEIGVNYNKNKYSFRDYFNEGSNNKNANRDFDGIWAPNFTLLYNLTENHQLFGNVSYGFSFPNLEETLTPSGVINPDIGPETGINYELGTENFFFQRKLKTNITFYYMNVDNLLVAERVGEDQFIGKNAGETSHKGLEVSVNYVWDAFRNITIQPYANATFNNHSFVDFTDGDEDFSGNDLTGVPENLWNAGFSVSHEAGIYFSTTYQHVGELPMNDQNSLYYNANDVVNIKAAYQTLLFSNFNLEINGGINNVFNEKYASSILINAVGFGGSQPRYYYPGLPVNYFGGVKIGYRF